MKFVDVDVVDNNDDDKVKYSVSFIYFFIFLE